MVGDGSSSPVVIAGDKLKNYDELINTTSTLAPPACIKSSRAALGKLVFR